MSIEEDELSALSKPLADLVVGIQRGDRILSLSNDHLKALGTATRDTRELVYGAIRENDRIATVIITPVPLNPPAAPPAAGAPPAFTETEFRHFIYAELGQALGTMTNLRRVTFVLETSIAALTAVSQLAQCIRQNRRMFLSLSSTCVHPTTTAAWAQAPD